MARKRPNGNKEERSRCCQRRVTTGERELKSGNTDRLGIARGNREQTEGNGRIRRPRRVRGNRGKRKRERNSIWGKSSTYTKNHRNEKRILNKYATFFLAWISRCTNSVVGKMRPCIHWESCHRWIYRSWSWVRTLCEISTTDISS